MTGRIFTADHHVYDLPPLLSWNVRHTGTVPCDSWSVTAVYQPEMLTVLRMAAGFAAIENGMTQLRGIVDEYTVELGSRGMTVTLSGRGYAARLLDNESRPVTYEQVTLRELVRCHGALWHFLRGCGGSEVHGALYRRGGNQPMEGDFGVLPDLWRLPASVCQNRRAAGNTGAGQRKENHP